MEDVLMIGNGYEDPPIIRAARHPDIIYLRRSIERFNDSTTPERICFDPNFRCDECFQGHSATPLIEAARHGMEQHVAMLLEAGADPDRIERRHMGKPLAQLDVQHLSGGVLALRKGEDKRARFWSHLDPPHEVRRGLPSSALEAAAVSGNVSIVKMILATSSAGHTCQGKEGKISASASSALIAAVKHGHMEVVQLLLKEGFDPAAMPDAGSWTCITPPMALTYAMSKKLEVLKALCQIHAEPALLNSTPIFDINTFHFAAAALDRPLLDAMTEHVDIKQVSPTALSHTLLHIACLPFDDTYINVFSQAIADSVHDARTLCTEWHPESIAFFRYVDRSEDNREIANVEFGVNERSAFLLPHSTESFSDQYSMIRYLAAAGVADCSAQDYMGNTPLHYLASYRIVNKEALNFLLSFGDAAKSWATIENEVGYTAADLYELGQLVTEVREAEGLQ